MEVDFDPDRKLSPSDLVHFERWLVNSSYRFGEGGVKFEYNFPDKFRDVFASGASCINTPCVCFGRGHLLPTEDCECSEHNWLVYHVVLASADHVDLSYALLGLQLIRLFTELLYVLPVVVEQNLVLHCFLY